MHKIQILDQRVLVKVIYDLDQGRLSIIDFLCLHQKKIMHVNVNLK